jgi:hypothetical protein
VPPRRDRGAAASRHRPPRDRGPAAEAIQRAAHPALLAATATWAKDSLTVMATAPAGEAGLIKVACILAVLMLLLTATIVVNAIWRWYVILARPGVALEPAVPAINPAD